MATREMIALLLSFFLLSPYQYVYGYSPNDIKLWCPKTPNPQPCEYFLSQDKTTKPIKGQSDFFKVSMQVALDRAMIAKRNTYSVGPKCRNEREKAAWTDCVKLYEDITVKLNYTMSPSTKCTKEDAQTWLSATLTNLETCRTGFVELGVSDYVLPLLSNNVSKLISNTLAINNNMAGSPPSSTTNDTKEGFPPWVKPGDRKLLQTSSPASQANIVVAKDGSGNYKTIKEALGAKRSGSGRFIIYIKAGVYSENVEIGKSMKNIMLVGDGIGKTIITGSKSVGGGSTTFNSGTVIAVGDGFIARDITIRNTAGPQNHQAVALRSSSDLSVFYKCGFEGYQDTLYVHSQRQFYRECDIYGTVDFIFGNAAVVLQNCNIFCRKPPNRTNTVTAQGRTDPNQNTGISIHNSRVSAADDLTSVKTYLGRPWQQYSRTVFMKTSLDGIIDPAGWLAWSGNFALNTLYYGEYMNTGAGSSTANRVTWKGYRRLSAADASQFTVSSFIAGTTWLPATNVPFTSGL